MNADLIRMKSAVQSWATRSEKRGERHAGQDAWKNVAIEALREVRELSDPMVKAMLETEWPEGMSAPDQMRAMFRAAIDVVLEEHAR